MSKSPGKKPIDTSHLSIPPESMLLRTAYESSGLIVSAMAKATGISTPAIFIALNGFRYRKGVPPIAVSPPNKTLVKLAAVLRIEPDALRKIGRDHAAKLLEEFAVDELLTVEGATALDSVSMPPGRQILARQVLGVFSTDELRAEIARRETMLADKEFYADDSDL